MPTTVARLDYPQFRFRQKELALILSCWRDGQSVLLTGIRRTGKSRLVKAALVKYAQAGGQIGFFDAEDCASLHDFYRAILSEMPKSLLIEIGDHLKSLKTVPDRLLNWIRSHVAKVEILEQSIELQPTESLHRYWQPIVDALEVVLARHPANELPVLGIDELPFMLENLIRAGVPDGELVLAMASLRKLRDAGLRMIIAGSISMENLLTLHGIPHTVLGGLLRVPVPPFSKPEAAQYLGERLAGKPAGAKKAIALSLKTLPDYVPEFLNIAVQHLQLAVDEKQCAASFKDDIFPAIRRSFLTQFDERLVKNYPGPQLPIAEEILDRIAKADDAGTLIDSSTLPDGHRQVKQMLQYDNFIIEGTEFRWQFCLNLLRQWWRSQRGIL